MDLFDAVKSIAVKYPEIPQDEIRYMLDAETKSEEERLDGRNKYARAVENAHHRILDWLANGEEYRVNLRDNQDLARFVSSHRQACVWAVIYAKSRVTA